MYHNPPVLTTRSLIKAEITVHFSVLYSYIYAIYETHAF